MRKSPWAWVPTLYFTEGIPYVVVASSRQALAVIGGNWFDHPAR